MLQVKLPAGEIEIGMYVANLDRPWLGTPFPFQGFMVKDSGQIHKLREICQFVFVDTEKGRIPRTAERGAGDAPLPVGVRAAPLPRPQVAYNDESTLSEEFTMAKQIRGALIAAVDDLFTSVATGTRPDFGSVTETVRDMERCVLRNPDAFMLLNKIRQDDNYTYRHAIQCSAYSIAFGRQLGLPTDQIHELALGALLFDIGKSKLPQRLLEQTSLNLVEFEVVKMHVKHSVDILSGSPAISPRTLAMVMTHHERFDGSGYMTGLAGGDIPLFGRIAGIVDYFDAVTSKRPYAPSVSLHEAIKTLYNYRNTLFQDELIEIFIQALGVYPVGTLVELSNGEVGFVEGQNRTRRLRPRVLVIRNEHAEELSQPVVRDLFLESEDPDSNPLHIRKCLEPGTYGICPNDYYV